MPKERYSSPPIEAKAFRRAKIKKGFVSATLEKPLTWGEFLDFLIDFYEQYEGVEK